MRARQVPRELNGHDRSPPLRAIRQLHRCGTLTGSGTDSLALRCCGAGDANSRDVPLDEGWKGWAEGCRSASQHQVLWETVDEHRASDARGLGRRGASQTGRLSRAVDRLLGGCMLDAGGLCGCAADDDGGRGFIYLERSDSPCSLVKLRAVPISGEQRAYRQNTWGEARLSSGAGAGAAGLGRRGWLLRLGACGGARRKTVTAPARVLRAWLTGGAHRAGWASTVGWGWERMRWMG